MSVERNIDLPESAFIFEIAAEVCWKIGGIHTVIASKAESMVNSFGPNYYLIGPYSSEVDYTGVFEEVEPEAFPGSVGRAIVDLKNSVIDVHCGYWNIQGRHLKIINSYLQAPQIHAAAVKNPKMKGGPFMDLQGGKVEEVKKLREATMESQKDLLDLATAIKELDKMLKANA